MMGMLSAAVRARPGLRDALVAATIVAGMGLMLGAVVYRCFVRPEWPAEVAFAELWPMFSCGAAMLATGWYIDRTAG